MPTSIIQEYMDSLAALSGNDFQAEVSARLQSVIVDFQTVPAKPQGDAGLDAFSHGGTRGYCCYGLEHDQFKTNKKREEAIIDKFRSDLRRLFELGFQSAELTRVENPEMASILPLGKKLKHITLVTNWFESHKVLSPILTEAARYKAASKCKYVEQAATIVVLGPKELANRYAVDEMTINRVRQRGFIQQVQQAASRVEIADLKGRGFDEKMGILREIAPERATHVDSLSEGLRAHWRTALAFERKLHEALPALHQALEDGRRVLLTQISRLMLNSSRPWEELGRAEELARGILEPEFGKQYGMLVREVSFGEVARLIGECPIGWKKPGVTHG